MAAGSPDSRASRDGFLRRAVTSRRPPITAIVDGGAARAAGDEAGSRPAARRRLGLGQGADAIDRLRACGRALRSPSSGTPSSGSWRRRSRGRPRGSRLVAQSSAARRLSISASSRLHPDGQVGSIESPRGLEREPPEEAEVPVTERHRLPARRELIGRVLADRLEHPIARGLPVVGDDERAVDEAAEAVERGEPRDRRRRLVRGAPSSSTGGVPSAVTRRRGIERPAAGEDGQPAEEPAIGVVEQVPAPVDERLQRPLPRHRRASATGQQAEPVAQALGDLVGGEDIDPRGRQLDARAGCRRAAGRSRRRRAHSTDPRRRPAGLPWRARRTSGRPPTDLPARRARPRSPAGCRAPPSRAGSASDGTAKTASPSTPSGSRLVVEDAQRRGSCPAARRPHRRRPR